jgi:hypothetical protein
MGMVRRNPRKLLSGLVSICLVDMWFAIACVRVRGSSIGRVVLLKDRRTIEEGGIRRGADRRVFAFVLGVALLPFVVSAVALAV